MLEDLLSKGSMLKNFNPKFKIFKGLFDLEDQDQGYLFLSSSETFTRPIHIGKIQNNSQVITFTRNHTDDDVDGTKNHYVSPRSGVGGRHKSLS